MKPWECGTTSPLARAQVERMTLFLRLAGPAGSPTPLIRWLVANDPEMRGFVLGVHPLTLDDLR